VKLWGVVLGHRFRGNFEFWISHQSRSTAAFEIITT
jgi:hypothetical protein